MTALSCEECKYTRVPGNRYPCKSCGDDMRNFQGRGDVMAEKSCEECKHETLDIIRKPCSVCLADPFSMFEPKSNYGSCRDGHITPDGDCGVFKKQTPCLQWDCTLWGNEPAKATPDAVGQLMDRIDHALYLAEQHGENTMWHEETKPALMDRIEARARAMYRVKVAGHE